MKALFALSVLAAAASALSFKADPFWKAYKASFDKSYESEAEEARRYDVFMQNMQMAAELNADETEDAEYGMTIMSDRFPEEINTHLEIPEDIVTEDIPIVEAPTSFDARKKGWVPAVRSQGQCGSCWAFCTTSSISIAYAKKKGKSPLVLSEQQLVDCSPETNGCNGGWPVKAANYAKKGMMLNSDYPYKAKNGSCKYSASKVKVKVASSAYITKSVAAMKSGIQSYGSLMVCLDARKMHSYKNGIMGASGCTTTITHAVNAIGWGKSGSTEYWIIRNSWGASWGEKGYFRIVTGKNACGIEKYPAYVSVV